MSLAMVLQFAGGVQVFQYKSMRERPKSSTSPFFMTM